jgi:hypothetical protein
MPTPISVQSQNCTPDGTLPPPVRSWLTLGLKCQFFVSQMQIGRNASAASPPETISPW